MTSSVALVEVIIQNPAAAPNARVATGVAVADVREYIMRTLKQAT